MAFKDLSAEELSRLKEQLEQKYNEFQSRNLNLDMSRGKPAPDQLKLSEGISSCSDYASYKEATGTDCRNYGGIDGLPEMKQIFADILEMDASNIIIGGNSSLNMMFDCISQGMTKGYGDIPWGKQEKIKFICPSPGYDRHFAVTEYFGFELLTVKMLETGPDMDEVEELIKDPAVKGIWCVPKYSNPTGITFTDETVRRFANLKPAAKDFRIFWDNAYVIHDLFDNGDKLLNLYDECKKVGNEDIVLTFASTSKIVYPGSGVACVACSDANKKALLNRLKFQTIGPDKMNQLSHIQFFKNSDGVRKHMELHSQLLRPKFETVLRHLNEELKDDGIIEWTHPNGGYFVSVDLTEGCASKVVELCEKAGVKLTPAGATYPYGKDPGDKNIRLSPSFPPVEELELAMELFCICAKLASIEKLLNK